MELPFNDASILHPRDYKHKIWLNKTTWVEHYCNILDTFVKKRRRKNVEYLQNISFILSDWRKMLKVIVQQLTFLGYRTCFILLSNCMYLRYHIQCKPDEQRNKRQTVLFPSLSECVVSPWAADVRSLKVSQPGFKHCTIFHIFSKKNIHISAVNDVH